MTGTEELPTSRKVVAAPDPCWKVCKADRAAVLIDGEAYFSALRSCLLQAQRSVFIVGWDIDSRTRLISDARDSDPVALGSLLNHIANARPDLEIRLLLWDYSVLYTLDRELLPELNLGWNTPPQVQVCLDDVLPLGASHHQKLVVVDDAVAFCGGLDVTIRRWDTSDHRADDPARVDPDDKPYGPFHDVQMVVDGPAAAALAVLVRERWNDAACETPSPVAAVGDPWPEGVTPDFTDINIGLARTRPALHDRPEIKEVEALYLRAIQSARRSIYIENQYLTTTSVAKALARRMGDQDELEVVVVGPEEAEGWLEARTMGAGRIRFMRFLKDAGLDSRIRLVHPVVPGPSGAVPVMVHAKVMIVDDVLLRVGSSNLNHRSMGLDTECDLVIEAATEEERRTILGIRNRLIAEHLGVAAQEVDRACSETGSLISALDRLAGGNRTLLPIEDDESLEDGVTEALGGFADAERPTTIEGEIGDLFGGQPAKRPLSRLALQFMAAGAILAVVLAWRWLPIGDLVEAAALERMISPIRDSGWVFPVMAAIYVVAGLLVVPITVLIAATAAAFGPWEGFMLAAIGSQISAATTFLVGRIGGRPLLRRMLGIRLNRISRRLGRAGILSMMALRMVPIAPFTLINVVAGASRFGFRDYLFGTLLGMMPGIVIMTVLGDRLRWVLQDPGTGQLAAMAAAIALWIALSVALQYLVGRFDRNRSGDGATQG